MQVEDSMHNTEYEDKNIPPAPLDLSEYELQRQKLINSYVVPLLVKQEPSENLS